MLLGIIQTLAITLSAFSTMLIAALIVWILRDLAAANPHRQYQNIRTSVFRELSPRSSLTGIIDNAVELSNSRSLSSPDPLIRLKSTLRVFPDSFATAAKEIPRGLREGRSISVDLNRIDPQEARRLVEFCSGAIAMCNGSMFALTATVIILTPGDIVDP